MMVLMESGVMMVLMRSRGDDGTNEVRGVMMVLMVPGGDDGTNEVRG